MRSSRTRIPLVLAGYALILLLGACITSSTTMPPTNQPVEDLPALTAMPPANEVTEGKPTGIPAAQATEPSLCQEREYEDHPYYTIVEPAVRVDMVWKASFIPWWVRSTQDGKLLGIAQKVDTIFELMPDGSREVYFRCPGVKIESFTVATDGSIWFGSGEEHRLYRRNPDGSVEIIKKGIDRFNLEAGPDGSVYAMFHGLMKFEQDGIYEEITKMVSGRKFTVRPNGEIVFTGGIGIFGLTPP